MQQIGPYRIEGELARGGQGVVYRARHPERDGSVALKLLLNVSPHTRRRLQAELQALLRLEHPSLVRLLDAGEHQGTPWIAQRLVEGDSLQERLTRGGPLAIHEAVRIVHRLALALDYAHGCGVLHRDLKPANVILRPDGTPVLLDFGLARDVDSEASRISRSGVLLGTPGYWAPEQAHGAIHDMGPHTDVYGLGALLYALIAGHPPIQAPTLMAALQASFTCEPLTDLRPEVSPALSDVVARCLAPEPGERYASCAEFARALLSADQSPTAPPEPSRRAGLLWVVAAALAVVALAGTLVWTLLPNQPDPAEATDPVFALLEEAQLAFDAHEFARAEALVDKALTLAPSSARPHSLRGQARVKLGEWEAGIADLDRALELDPRLSGAWAARGLAQGQLGRYEDAVADLDRAVALDPDLPQLWTVRGFAHLGVDHGPEALADFDRALELDSDLADAWQGRGRALVRTGHYEEALVAFERALDIAPEAPASYLGRASVHEGLGQFEPMRRDMNRALELDPENATLWFKLAQIEARLGYAEASLEKLRGAVALAPENLVAARTLVRMLRTQDRHAEALAQLDSLVAQPGALPGDLVERGQTLRQFGRYDEALADFNQALARDPSSAAAHTGRGDVRFARESFREALSDYTRALELSPPADEVNPLRQLSELCLLRIRAEANLLQANFAAALTDLDQVVQIQSGSASAYGNRGLAKLKLERPDEAIADFDRALELDPELTGVHTSRGTAKAMLGRTVEAITDFNVALERDPNDSVAYTERGDAKLDLGLPGSALEDYDQALRIAPESGWAYGNRARAKFTLGRHEEALADYTQALRHDQDNPAIYGNRGQTLAELERFEEAIADYSQALRLEPSAEHYANRGAAQHNLGRYAEAIADYDRSLAFEELSPLTVESVRENRARAAAKLEE